MKRNLVTSFFSLFLLTGCSLNEIMDDLTNFNNLEMIIAVLIVVGLIVSIVLKLLSRSGDNYEKPVKKEKSNNINNFSVHQNIGDSNGFNNKNNNFGNIAPSTTNAGIDFEFYSDKNVNSSAENSNQLNNSNVNDINKPSLDNVNVVNNQINNNDINAINNIPLVESVNQGNNDVSNEISSVPLVNDNVGFNDLVNLNDSNSDDNSQLEGPVINLNNQSVVINSKENE